ncbi:MAG: rhomboid family intramembrane serine protease [Lentisphaerae bacterium]|nr:MAG: rhomboid family intramembrane serine protease [Lentisphaerota bacterium]
MLPLGDSIPTRQPAITTWLLIGANAVVFFLQLTLPRESLEQVFQVFGVVPARYVWPEQWTFATGIQALSFWPLLTSQFLHGGWFHIFANMWTLWVFGDNVEGRLGPIRFLLFYLLCGIAAGLIHILLNPNSTVPAVGASGAISGVLGAYLLMFPTSRLILMVPIFFFPFFFEMPAVTYIAAWFLMQLFSGTLSLLGPEQVGGVAWWAHIGGFLGGLVLTPIFLGGLASKQKRFPDDGWIEHAWKRGW